MRERPSWVITTKRLSPSTMIRAGNTASTRLSRKARRRLNRINNRGVSWAWAMPLLDHQLSHAWVTKNGAVETWPGCNTSIPKVALKGCNTRKTRVTSHNRSVSRLRSERSLRNPKLKAPTSPSNPLERPNAKAIPNGKPALRPNRHWPTTIPGQRPGPKRITAARAMPSGTKKTGVST